MLYQVTKTENIEMPMRDGVILRADLYRPEEPGPLPAILLRLPYGKDMFDGPGSGVYDPYYYAARGYNVVIQDCRGFYHSDGEPDVSGGNDFEDGYDTIEWIASREWCDGNVGTFGLSFFGYVQLAAASENPPHLRCICPFECSSTHPITLNENGSYAPYHLTWLYNSAADQVRRLDTSEEEKALILGEIEKNRPTIMDQVLKIHPWPDMPALNIPGFHYFDEFMESVDGNNDPAYWEALGYPLDFRKMRYPAFLLTGWYDHVRDSEMENYDLIRAITEEETDPDPDALRLVIGPWAHGQGMSQKIGNIDYGSNASWESADLKGMMCRFFDRWLKGDTEALKGDAPVVYYTLIEDRWKTASCWPVPGSVMTPYYLSSKNSARSSRGDGTLHREADFSGTPEDTYLHDPENPVPSELPGLSNMNGDFSTVQEREDVLCYTTPEFETDTEITGRIEADIFAAVDADDGDLYLRLTDVAPDGSAVRLTSGSLRLRYYQSLSEAHYVEAGSIGRYRIRMGDLSYLLPAGHRLRLDIAGSAFPYADANLGTREPLGRGTAAVKALHHILHDPEHPSCLLLPICSRQKEKNMLR